MSKLLKTKKPKLNTKLYLHHIQPTVDIAGFDFYDVSKLSKIKSDSIEEIIIQDLLEYFSDSESTILFNNIVGKLKSGGKLHIQGLDSKALCYGIVYSQVDISTFKLLVYGSGKGNIYTINQMKTLIGNVDNISINKIKFLNGLQYYIECVKK